jgi:glycosyltransferase involved in cell wall biosynthesis
VVSSELTVRAFLRDHIKILSHEYHISVVFNTGKLKELTLPDIPAVVLPVKIMRGLSPLHDLAAFVQLFMLFRKSDFDIVHSITPKAGLLAMLAGMFAGVHIRIHTFTGQVWVTRGGFMRHLLKAADRLINFAATNILVDSISQREFLIREGVITGEKSCVLAKGSICGINPRRFRLDNDARRNIRKQLGIPVEDLVFLYLGRLNRDKGLLDLAQAFAKVASSASGNVHLLIVGPDEEEICPQIESLCKPCAEKLHFVGYTEKSEAYMAAADVFCLPSYREGFGSVILEAAAVGIPSIGSRIYGIIDAIEDGVTGLLHEPRNIRELTEKMLQLAENPEQRHTLGREARSRALRDFNADTVTTAMADYYRELVGKLA